MIPDGNMPHSRNIAEIGMHVIQASMQMKMKTIMTSAFNYGMLDNSAEEN